MAHPLRLELAGALYHVTSRGDGREDIYLGDDDRHMGWSFSGIAFLPIGYYHR